MRQKSQAYYNDFVEWLEAEDNQNAMRYFFENWDYTAIDFTPDFPLRTRYTAEMEGRAEDWPGSVIELALDHPMTPFDVASPLMFESDIINIVVGLSSHYGFEAKMAEGLSSGKRGPRQLLRDVLESMDFTCVTEERFKRTVGKTQKWDKAWLMAGVGN